MLISLVFKYEGGSEKMRYLVFAYESNRVYGGSDDILFAFSTYRDLSSGLLKFSKDHMHHDYNKFEVYDTDRAELLYVTEGFGDRIDDDYDFYSPKERTFSFLEDLARSL